MDRWGLVSDFQGVGKNFCSERYLFRAIDLLFRRSIKVFIPKKLLQNKKQMGLLHQVALDVDIH